MEVRLLLFAIFSFLSTYIKTNLSLLIYFKTIISQRSLDYNDFFVFIVPLRICITFSFVYLPKRKDRFEKALLYAAFRHVSIIDGSPVAEINSALSSPASIIFFKFVINPTCILLGCNL